MERTVLNINSRTCFDGGVGSQLQARGLQAGELPETWNLTHPEDILDIHMAYLKAGCDIFNANTFGANALRYPDNLREIIEAALEIAKEARRRTGREDARITLNIGPSGRLLEPMGDLSFEDAVSLFGEVVRIGAAAGADLVLIETMTDSLEAKAAVLAAKENCDLPVCLTMVFDPSGHMLTGGTPESMTAMLEGLGVDALGINCSLGPEQMAPIAERFLAAASVPVIVNPNAGLPRVEDGLIYYDITPELFAQAMRPIAESGAQGIGGCCGTTPDHIRLLIESCRDIPYSMPVEKNLITAGSSSQVAVFSECPVVLGTPTDADAEEYAEAIADEEAEDLADLILEYEDEAEVLEICVDHPETDGAAFLPRVIQAVQGMTALPLLIESEDPDVLEAGLRVYNGKPVVRVTAADKRLRMVLPLAKKYGALVLALAEDADGVPQDDEARSALQDRIRSAAEEAGIAANNLLFI